MAQAFSGLRLRLLLLVVLASAAPVALALYQARQDRRQQTSDWRERSLETVQLTTRAEDELVTGTRQLLLTVAESSQVRSWRRTACNTLLAKLLANFPQYANVGIIATNGEVFASALPVVQSGNLADRPFFRRALHTRALSIGDYQVSSATGRPTLSFGYPLVDRFDEIEGVVFAELDLDRLNRFEASIQARLPAGAIWTKTDRSGTILVRHPNPEKWVGKPFPERTLLKTALARRDGVLEAPDLDGVPSFYAFAATRSPLVAGDVVTILSIPKRVLFAIGNQMLVRDLRGVAIVAGLVLVIGWAGSSVLIVRPVQALLRSIGQLASGNLGARTGLPHDTDEFGRLAGAFDQMAESLEQRDKDRQRAQTALQAREDLIRELPLLPAAVYVCDPSGMIELYNRTAVELWGYESEDHFASARFCGSHRLYAPDGTPMPHDESPMAEVLNTGLPVRNRELVIERPDGSRIPVLMNAVPFRDPQGVMVGAVSVVHDITERKLAEEKLKEFSRRLQDQSRRLLEVQEAERRHIARELHDEIGQALTVAEMNLQAALQPSDRASVVPHLRTCLETIERVQEQVHDLSLDLRPSILDDLGLEPALRWYTERQASLTGLRVKFQADSLKHRLDPVIETACFRVAQEALTNVVRHARARTVTVQLHEDAERLHLSVHDDGKGFDVAVVRERAIRGASLGLLSMEERATLAGGALEYRSAPGQGTEVRAWFPPKSQPAHP
jgi:PAS domain S-box-containing protein